MDHYLDIHLLPDPEFPPTQLMSALFAKLHTALVQIASNDIGVSFPSAPTNRNGLGARLRLHGPAQALERLTTLSWLGGIQDHVQLGEISKVPPTATHQVVRRVQAKSNPQRLRRRQMKRKGWTAEQALAAIPDTVVETLRLPFLAIRSQSTGQSFRFFVDQHPVDHATPGTFNTYGMSAKATVPRF